MKADSAITKAVTIHCDCPTLVPKSFWIAAIAVLTIVKSMQPRKLAMATPANARWRAAALGTCAAFGRGFHRAAFSIDSHHSTLVLVDGVSACRIRSGRLPCSSVEAPGFTLGLLSTCVY